MRRRPKVTSSKESGAASNGDVRKKKLFSSTGNWVNGGDLRGGGTAIMIKKADETGEQGCAAVTL